MHKSLCTSYIRVNPVKRNTQTCITLVIHHTQSIGKKYVYKLLFVHVQILKI